MNTDPVKYRDPKSVAWHADMEKRIDELTLERDSLARHNDQVTTDNRRLTRQLNGANAVQDQQNKVIKELHQHRERMNWLERRKPLITYHVREQVWELTDTGQYTARGKTLCAVIDELRK